MEVAVIGAGINGSYIAWQLAQKGHKVMLFDKKKDFKEVVCSGLVSERIWDFIPRNDSLMENRVDYADIHFKKKDIRLTFYPQMIVVDRTEWISTWLSLHTRLALRYISAAR